VKKSELQELVAVSWKLATPGGMPSNDELKKIYRAEDLLSAAVESKQLGIETVVVTGNGIVEWRFYTRDHKAFMSELNKAFESEGKLPISISLQEDPSWSAYEKFHAIK
jgi:hypothetical protein